MRIIAAVKSIKADIDREIARGQRAVRGGIADATTGLKTDLRRQMIAAGLGQRMANTWRSKVMPEGPSLDADGMVWSKAREIVHGFATGALIRARSGVYLARPLPAAGKGPRGRRMTPAAWERRTGRKLKYIPPRRGRNALLVTDAATGSFSQTGRAGVSRKRAGRATVPIFVLLRQVKLPRSLDPQRAVEKATQDVPRRIEARWKASAS